MRITSLDTLLNKKLVAYLLFLIPLVLIVIRQQFNAPLEGDEHRYLAYANNLLNGFYTDVNNPSLTNGPRYPIILALLLKLKFSIIGIRKLNLVFLFGAFILFYSTSNFLLKNNKTALAFTLLFEYYILTCNGEYFKVLTEPFVILLICLITYLTIKNVNSNKIVLGLAFGFLVLTKVVFAYVIISLLFVLIGLKFIKIQPFHNAYVFFKILILALLTNMPYLAYTYSITNRLLCWSDHGGKTLYWMSSPYKYEYGDHIPVNLKITNPSPYIILDTNYIPKNHKKKLIVFCPWKLLNKIKAFLTLPL